MSRQKVMLEPRQMILKLPKVLMDWLRLRAAEEYETPAGYVRRLLLAEMRRQMKGDYDANNDHSV